MNWRYGMAGWIGNEVIMYLGHGVLLFLSLI